MGSEPGSPRLQANAITPKLSYAFYLVGNIPSHFHAADLRNFFSHFLERKKFRCFHFRHRPQRLFVKSQTSVQVTEETSSSECHAGKDHPEDPLGESGRPEGERHPLSTSSGSADDRLCCVVKLKVQDGSSFVLAYNGVLWIDPNGLRLPSRCRIAHLNIGDASKLSTLPELRPPAIMPRGNVGTPTEYFWKQIQACTLPSGIVGKLQLKFKKKRGQSRYSHVPLDYRKLEGRGKIGEEVKEVVEDAEEILTGSGAVVGVEDGPGEGIASRSDEVARDIDVGEEDDEEEELEEWERHEMLHDDVTQQARNKERLYEEEMEIVWEKGGSGLVFYTDAFFWDQFEGGFDGKSTDDWDVDVEGAEGEGRGILGMQRETRLREGLLQESCFRQPKQLARKAIVVGNAEEDDSDGEERRGSKKKKRAKTSQQSEIGRQVLESFGWTEGRGLGRGMQGIKEPVDVEGRKPRDTRGLGFYGPSLREQRQKMAASTTTTTTEGEDDVRIYTVYDDIYQSHARAPSKRP